MCDTCGCNITPGNEHLARQKNPQGQDAVTVLKSLLGANDREAATTANTSIATACWRSI